jgi:hypothetical protein
MRFFTYLLGVTGLFILSLPFLMFFTLLEEQPASALNTQLSRQNLEDIQGIVLNNGPGLLGGSETLLIELNEQESNALLTYLIRQGLNADNQWLEGLGANLTYQPELLSLEGTVAINLIISRSYLNFSARFIAEDNHFILAGLQLSDHEIPAFIFQPLLDAVKDFVSTDPNFRLASAILASINSIRIADQHIEFNLNWESESLLSLQSLARQLLIDPLTAEQLLSYQRRLQEILAGLPENRRSASLMEVLVPLFSHALAMPGRPKEENRAIFTVLCAYVLTELNLADLLGPLSAELSQPRQLRITLESRDDLPRHLIASAAIAAYADNDLADILAFYKEVQDSRTSSGFSFSDMSANRVGTRLGILSNTSESAAENLQRFFAKVQREDAFMPLVGGPDGISEVEFIRRYGSRNSEAYELRIREIEQKIDALPVFQANRLP